MLVPKGVKAVIMASAGAAIVSTPLYWLLGGPDSGQLAAASVQGATGVVALAWSLLAPPAVPGPAPEPASPAEPAPAPAPELRATDAADADADAVAVADVATDTGQSRARAGGKAISGVLRESRADGRSARVERSGDAIAEGPGLACSGVYCR
ncbi:hypothetical protein CU044_2009 [Streptomyces sp. L-9-10]|uniref:hypothetical protein n=1 Tax=Streptomyces sp. L-9-10 TaxID=1478131 RepID=UPI0010F34721|nr:hypothetical protein [Streptomyces sp. L-9-10]RYJ29540.1 hypothetical protein CU044_2009 [Streptomyces sp. L-9-10]